MVQDSRLFLHPFTLVLHEVWNACTGGTIKKFPEAEQVQDFSSRICMLADRFFMRLH